MARRHPDQLRRRPRPGHASKPWRNCPGRTQILFFTHHDHLAEIARVLPRAADVLFVHRLDAKRRADRATSVNEGGPGGDLRRTPVRGASGPPRPAGLTLEIPVSNRKLGGSPTSRPTCTKMRGYGIRHPLPSGLTAAGPRRRSPSDSWVFAGACSGSWSFALLYVRQHRNSLAHVSRAGGLICTPSRRWSRPSRLPTTSRALAESRASTEETPPSGRKGYRRLAEMHAKRRRGVRPSSASFYEEAW